MDAKTYRGQIILELSLFVLIIVSIVSLTMSQIQKMKKEFRENRIGKTYEKN